MRAALAAFVLAAALLGARPTPAEGDAARIAHALPRLVFQGGPFLRHPRIVTITFAGDDADMVRRLDAFGARIARSDWWRAVTEDLCTPDGDCVGEGRDGRSVVLAERLPANVEPAAITALLERALVAGTLGTIDDDTLLLVYLPSGVALSDERGARFCADGPRGFHRALRLPSKMIPYAVVPRCGDLDDVTATASHEILEATTDPDPSRRGFAFAGGSEIAGFTAAGVEPVDPCGLLTRNAHRVREGELTVQRAWSNAAAARGTEPCVPADPQAPPYLALLPERPAVRLRTPGERAVVELAAVAADPAAEPWTVSTVELGTAPGEPSAVEAILDRTEVANGDTLKLTVTAREGADRDRHVIGLVSRRGETTFVWPLLVVTR